jgi:hypothetical protein
MALLAQSNSSLAASAPLYLEKKLAQKIGVPREQLAELRKQVVQKKHTWTEGRETVITEQGLARVLEVLRATSNSPLSATDFTDCLLHPPINKNGATASNGVALAELTVVRIYPNRRLLRARLEDGPEVDVRVPDNKNFVPKMKLRARPASDRPNTWKMEGRCPRSRGRY